MEKTEGKILVIFGASGDLTAKKLVPALYELFKNNLLNEKFAVLGVGRTSYSDHTFRKLQEDNLVSIDFNNNNESTHLFLEKFFYLSISTDKSEDYVQLREKLINIDAETHSGRNYIYYLATPPSMYGPIASNLYNMGLTKNDPGNWKRIVFEKPFGVDLQSALNLNSEIHKYFEENQVYRIDHYLGKETVQNILVTRFSNGIFEPLWNRSFISHIEISSFENFGVENRGKYYDHAGTLRDMVQNHLMQLVSLTAMEPPAQISPQSIRDEQLKVFQALRPIDLKQIENQVVRGQYTSNTGKYPSYLDEKDVNPDSKAETFVAMKFFIDNWRWAGVPFFIRTGKYMPTRVTEIVVHFKPTPHPMFMLDNQAYSDSNQLILRIQPDEGLLFRFGMKVPGAGFKVQNVSMDFHYSNLKDIQLTSAYARLLHDCINGDPTLYTREDAIEATWRFIDPILEFWKKNPETPLFTYKAGTWGPLEADNLISDLGLTWRYPCKNIEGEGNYCEL